MCAADSGKLGTATYHNVSHALLAITPLALIGLPSMVQTPIEVGLAVAFPLHAHTAMNYVISDYVPRPGQGPARIAMMAATGVAAVGLLKLAINGPGLCETVKRLWRVPQPVKEEDAKEE